MTAQDSRTSPRRQAACAREAKRSPPRSSRPPAAANDGPRSWPCQRHTSLAVRSVHEKLPRRRHVPFPPRIHIRRIARRPGGIALTLHPRARCGSGMMSISCRGRGRPCGRRRNGEGPLLSGCSGRMAGPSGLTPRLCLVPVEVRHQFGVGPLLSSIARWARRAQAAAGLSAPVRVRSCGGRPASRRHQSPPLQDANMRSHR